MDSGRLLTQLLVVMACCLATALARMATSMQDNGVDGLPESLFSHEQDVKRNSQEDISKLLLKHLRFRQLPEHGAPLSPANFAKQNGDQVEKRQEQRRLVNNLAALLTGLRDRQAESNMRMPSLRFGK